jgi:hypothetical protein
MGTRVFLHGGPLDGDDDEVADNEFGANGVFVSLGGKVHVYRTVSERRFRDGSAIRVAVYNDVLRDQEQEAAE